MSDTPLAIVTGAGSGVGRHAAVALARAGYSLVLLARTADKLEETAGMAESATGNGSAIEVMPTDLRDSGQTRKAIGRCIEQFKRIDAIANIAGYAPLLPIEKVTAEICRDTIDTNLTAIVNLTAEAWPTFQKQKSGVIVNVSSMASIDPFPGFAVYAAAKIGVNMFTRCIADEGKKHGIKAVSIAPGAIETEMFRANFTEKQFPKAKTLDPADVAQVIADCITGEREFTPGEVIQMPNP